jgi:hypothetical protein
MTALLLSWLVTGISVSGFQRLLLSLPLSLSIAVVYKTIRCQNLREVPAAAVVLWITIVLTMYALGIGLWIVFRIMA